MDAAIVKEGLNNLLEYIPIELPPMGWYFSETQPDGAITHGYDERSCMFNHLESIAAGKRLCLSAHHSGCMAGNCYLGFDEPLNVRDRIIAAVTEREKFKKTAELGAALFESVRVTPAKKEYLILARIADIQDGVEVEVVVLWVNGLSIAGLTTLANYDKESNNNVLIPFGSGCQGIWTLPYLEKEKAIVGCIDPSIRWKIPNNVLSFSVSAKQFTEMAGNASASFLTKEFWNKALGR
jgi:hypothetical protein